MICFLFFQITDYSIYTQFNESHLKTRTVQPGGRERMADYKMICPPSTAGGRYSDSTLVAEILKSMCNNVYKDAKTITN